MVVDTGTIGLPALVSFHAVARQGGISAAAEQLGIAKSGVSRHVAQLEAALGVRLLERGARSVRLTPVGHRLDARIRSILAEVELLGDIAREESAGVSGQVTIAATPEFGGLIATRLFPQIRRMHPDLTTLDNAFLLPHIGSATTADRIWMMEMAVDNAVAALRGETPHRAFGSGG